MNRVPATRRAWHPQNVEDHDAILRELRAILASPQFCNSKRYPALLQFIVENTLAGKSDLLKERTLGVEIFGRPQTYDTGADPIVRYTAGEVRKRLLLYYSEFGRDARVRISLPPGSYIPEFVHGPVDVPSGSLDHEAAPVHAEPAAANGHDTPQHGSAIVSTPGDEIAEPPSDPPVATPGTPPKTSRRRLLVPAFIVLFLCAVGGLWWSFRLSHSQSPVEAFWAPVLRDQRTVMLCTGSVVFSQDKYSGVTTANRDVDYSFVSMQSASAIAQVSGMLERSGVGTRLIPSSTVPLTDLREHSLALLGGYNNQWTLRLVQSLRYHFSPEPDHSIVDATQPQFRLERDHALPYSSADDYALVARFRDPVVDGWVVILAGIGRNGTEAAAQFATSPHYMRMLEDRVGDGFTSRNIEAVLKVNVIDGKTGAPSIYSTYVW